MMNSPNVQPEVASYSRTRTIILYTTCAVIIFALQCFLSLEGNYTLFQSHPLPKAFDSLSMNLLNGSAEVGDAIQFEVMEHDGKSYMYFGPLPAIVRIIPNLLWPHYFGKWSYLSFILAALLLLYFLVKTTLLCTSVNPDKTDTRFAKAGTIIGLSTLISFIAGAELILLTNRTIYHESILWALTATIATLFYTLRFFKAGDDSLLTLFCLGAWAGAALLARVPFGISTGLFCAAVLIKLLKNWSQHSKMTHRQHQIRMLLQGAALCIPSIACVCFQLWYNLARFDSVFMFYSIDGYQLGKKMEWAFAPATDSGFFNLRRIPRALSYYFLPIGLSVTETFPYLAPRPITAHQIFVRLHGSVMPLTLCATSLILGAALGIYTLIRNRSRQFEYFLVLACLPQFILLLTFNAIYQRYTFDLFPLIFVQFFLWLENRSQNQKPLPPSMNLCFLLAMGSSIAFTLPYLFVG